MVGELQFVVGRNHQRTPESSFCSGSVLYSKRESYLLISRLGEGSYATVYKARSLPGGCSVALKAIKLIRDEGVPFTVIREISILKSLHHSNVVILHDVVHTSDFLILVLEFMDSDLERYLYLYGKDTGIHAHNIRIFLFQVLRGLAYCQRKNILHRDLKPQNILINWRGELKLADFGLARLKCIPGTYYSSQIVTLWYRAPEVLLGAKDYYGALDLWAVGCIFVEMVAGKPLFQGKNVQDQLECIYEILGAPTEDAWPGLSTLPRFSSLPRPHYSNKLEHTVPRLMLLPQAYDLASSLLTLCPHKRFGCQVAMSHEYFSSLLLEVHKLDEAASIFSIPEIRLNSEATNNELSFDDISPPVQKIFCCSNAKSNIIPCSVEHIFGFSRRQFINIANSCYLFRKIASSSLCTGKIVKDKKGYRETCDESSILDVCVSPREADSMDVITRDNIGIKNFKHEILKSDLRYLQEKYLLFALQWQQSQLNFVRQKSRLRKLANFSSTSSQHFTSYVASVQNHPFWKSESAHSYNILKK